MTEFSAVKFELGWSFLELNGDFASFVGSDPYRILDWFHENLAISGLAGLSIFDDRRDDGLDHFIAHKHDEL